MKVHADVHSDGLVGGGADDTVHGERGEEGMAALQRPGEGGDRQGAGPGHLLHQAEVYHTLEEEGGTHRHKHAYTHEGTCMHTHVYVHACAHTQIHVCMFTQTHTHKNHTVNKQTNNENIYIVIGLYVPVAPKSLPR